MAPTRSGKKAALAKKNSTGTKRPRGCEGEGCVCVSSAIRFHLDDRGESSRTDINGKTLTNPFYFFVFR
jgi:hypothetical protein